jgi:hypothetical protein
MNRVDGYSRDARWARQQPLWVMLAAFGGLTLLVTWPLALRLATSIPGDYGDPLFVSWVIGTVAHKLSAAIREPSSLRSFWDAGIFHPELTTLAMSESFIPQTVMVLPIYWLTHNLILCYNIALVAAFVLTALGTALLVRSWTASLLAAVIAGVVASFNEYRLAIEVAHLQTLSIFGFPFALLGLHKYLATGRRVYLAGAAGAWLGLNLSSVYYLAYCSPFIAAFAVAETWRLGKWRHPRAWVDLATAALIVAALNAPFLIPYVTVQKRYGVYRSLAEVIGNSATLDHYYAVAPKLTVPLAFSIVSVAAAFVVAPRTRSKTTPLVTSAALVWIVVVMAICAMWLSLGPAVRFHGRTLDVPALYAAFMHVPGYSGLRVPSRFAGVFFVLLGVLTGLGASVLTRAWPRGGSAVTVVALVLFVWQGRHDHVALDRPLPSQFLAPPPAYLTPAPQLPPVYRSVERLPATSVLLEMPFGDPWYELRYMTFAAQHQRTLVNGYSGVSPPIYVWRQDALGNPMRDPARAWRAVQGATHVLVHKAAWRDATGEQVAGWLLAHGARELDEADGAVLLALPVQQ